MNVFELFFKNASDEEIFEAIKKLKRINIKDNYGRTFLYEACYWNRLEIIKFLIDHGADINIKERGGWTPLREACYWDRFELVKFLIEHGADAKNELEYCFKIKDIKRIRLLTRSGVCFL